MKRITILIATLAAGFVSMDNAGAQNVRTIESRILSMEARIQELEAQLAAKSGGGAVVQTTTGPADSAPSANETYIIRDGDSLGGIARKFAIPRQALLDANNMAEGQPIYIGETLVIPSTPTHAAAGSGTVHTVVFGDTLTGISRKYGTTITAIKKHNGLTSDVIATGQRLAIPGSGSPAPQTGTTQNVSTDGRYQYDNPLLNDNETYGYYAVQSGDNLYALARDFFTTMKELQRLNNLGSSTVIHPGDEMVVPTSKYNEYHGNVAAVQ